MKAISLWQPWASAMALGRKRLETRGWSTNYRGPLLIHAAKRWTRAEREFADLMDMPADLPLGALVAVGHLSGTFRADVANLPLSDLERSWGDFSAGRFAWFFVEIRPLPEPIQFRGAQGFFDVPDDILPAGAK